MSKKPYMYEVLEWLEIARRKDWNDPLLNPDDLAEYSEFQKPYARGDEDTYPPWEWSWPVIDFPPIPDITSVDPVPHPCSIDEDCIWAGIIGPEELECGSCYPYTQAHLFLGCDIAPWWAAFGGWSLSAGKGCYLLFGDQTSLIATVCCDDDAEPQTMELCYNGVLDCKGCISIELPTCCCPEFTLVGADTVDPGGIWTGTIDPACAGMTCSVSSNSDCTIACQVMGGSVAVNPGALDCGSFTVTVLGGNEDSDCFSASKTVMINDTGQGGSFEHCGGVGGPACNACRCACGGDATVFEDGIHRYSCSCWGGGICSFMAGSTMTCDDGFSVFTSQEAFCCDGCQNCDALQPRRSCGVYVWRCEC